MSNSFVSVQTNPAIEDRGIIDIHYPAGAAAGPLPFVLAVHGGGWRNGDRTSFHWVAQRLTPALGLPVVTCSYRISQTDPTFPHAYDDLLALLRWLRKHGRQHGLLDRCALLGSSAGGHLVCLLSTRGILENQDLIRIDATVAMCPVIDMVLQHQTDEAAGGSMTSRFIGGMPQQQPELYRLASPLHFVHQRMPPLWLAHGDADRVVSIAHSHALVSRLRERGVPHQFHIAPGRGHTMLQHDEGPRILLCEQEVVAFLQQHLQG